MTSAVSETCNEFLGPDYTIPGNSLTYSVTKSISTGWSFGGFVQFNFGDLSAPLGSAGFTFTYTETVTTGSVSGLSALCGDQPGNWTCGLDIAPKCVVTSGTCHTYSNDRSRDYGIQPYTASLPQTDNANGQSLSVYGENICVCNSCPGWADAGAIRPFCNLPYATCLDPPGGT